MRCLLDTHIFLWWLADDPRLGPAMRALIEDEDRNVLVSVVSLWEIVVKVRIGKLRADIAAIEQAILRSRFHRLDVKPAHLLVLTSLPVHHRDPFDHLLVAQAISESAAFVSDDQIMPLYPVELVGGSKRR